MQTLIGVKHNIFNHFPIFPIIAFAFFSDACSSRASYFWLPSSQVGFRFTQTALSSINPIRSSL
jgi:hypothetical protein